MVISYGYVKPSINGPSITIIYIYIYTTRFDFDLFPPVPFPRKPHFRG